jgi:hypothetical protein
MGRYIAILCLPIVLLGCTAFQPHESAVPTQPDDLDGVRVEIGDLALLKTDGVFLHHAESVNAKFTLANDSANGLKEGALFAHLCNAPSGEIARNEEILSKNRKVFETQEGVEFVLSDVFQSPPLSYTGRNPAEYRDVLPKGIFYVEIGTQKNDTWVPIARSKPIRIVSSIRCGR